MTAPEPKISRREHILQALAAMLESAPGARITTAALAKEVGVTEAALYRHFPSKARMFEGLIDFVEEVVFSRVGLILEEEKDARVRCEKIISLLLMFAERNPGITRILNGDALTGEHERLQARIVQFFDRLEAQVRQVLREAELKENLGTTITSSAAANLLMTFVEGHISRFVRSGFRQVPTEYWEPQWRYFQQTLFRQLSA
ncbi:MAG TPA: nucleoid occlusion factor SlmA [Moraxellaceae bacterium]|nr:nucleoid occlusion factor SlmA [Moraxellaceae bacterium]